MTSVYQFTRHGRIYRIVPTREINWRRQVGFKPKWPYVLVASDDCVVNGVTEQDLRWYRARGDQS